MLRLVVTNIAIITLTHIFQSQVHNSHPHQHLIPLIVHIDFYKHPRIMKLCVKYLPFILDFKYSNCLVKTQLARRVSYLEFNLARRESNWLAGQWLNQSLVVKYQIMHV